MGVSIRGAILITAKWHPKDKKSSSNGGGIRCGKMPSRVLGCHIWQLLRENEEVAKQRLVTTVPLNSYIQSYI